MENKRGKRRSAGKRASNRETEGSDQTSIILGVLQIVIPTLLILVAAPFWGNLNLRYIGITLVAVPVVIVAARGFRLIARRPRAVRAALMALAAVGGMLLGISVVPLSGHPDPSRGTAATPSTGHASGSFGASPMSSRGPAFSYFNETAVAHQDIDVTFKTGGYVRQVFTATGNEICSVAVIVSRDAAQDPSFDPTTIGRIRLSLAVVDATNTVIRSLRLYPREDLPSGQSDDAGVIIEAGPNHAQAVFDFIPVHTSPGDRLSFSVTNVEPGVALAFPLRPTGQAGTPVFWSSGLTNPPASGRTDRALAGYVCNVPTGC